MMLSGAPCNLTSAIGTFQQYAQFFQAPISGVHAISLWVQVAAVQSAWEYMMDARDALPEGYISFLPFPRMSIGSGWSRVIVHNRAVGTLEWSNHSDVISLPLNGTWTHIYLEAPWALAQVPVFLRADDTVADVSNAICDGTDVHVAGIMQHIEPAGIHSGDS